MKRILLTAAAVLCTTLLAGAATASAAASGVQVVEAKGPAFPERTYVLSLPSGRKLGRHDVKVTENGSPVVEQTVVPESAVSKKTFGVVLVLDTSYSMTGKPINASPTADIDIYTDANKVNTIIGVSGHTLFTIDLSQINPNLALGTTQNVVARGITMLETGGGFIDIAVQPIAVTP